MRNLNLQVRAFKEDDKIDSLVLDLITDFNLFLSFNPLPQDQSSAAVFVLSPCCREELSVVFPHYSNTNKIILSCKQCSKHWPFDDSIFLLTNQNLSWVFEDQDKLFALIEQFLDPLAATLEAQHICDKMVSIMNRASAEYAWRPEGNFRGASPLNLDQQKEILMRIIESHSEEKFYE